MPDIIAKSSRRLPVSSNIVNTFNPEVIVLGGILREIYPSVRDEANQALRQGALEGPREQVRVVLPGLGGDAVLVGAAERVFEALLADPAQVMAEALRWTRSLHRNARASTRS